MNQEDKSIQFLILLAFFFAICALIIEFLFLFNPQYLIDHVPYYFNSIINGLLENIELFRVLYLGSAALLLYSMGSAQSFPVKHPMAIGVFSLSGVASLLYIFQYHLTGKSPRDLRLYLAAHFFAIVFTYYIVTLIPKTKPKTKNQVIFGLNTKVRDKYSLKLQTHEGLQSITNPFQGVLVTGGPGAGKSASIIDPIIKQTLFSGYTQFIYDFKGNPPTLTKVCYNSLQMLKLLKKQEEEQWSKLSYTERVLKRFNGMGRKYDFPIPEFHMINFTDHALTSRINPISPRYVTSSLHAKTVATTIANALEKKWVKDKDFWAQNAISILHATIWNLVKNYPHIATLPHAICMILAEDLEEFISWLTQDEEIGMLMRPTIEAIRQEASGQIAGALSSIQLPLASLLNEDIFWVMSKDEAPMDINNPKRPAILCVANDIDKAEGISPGISLICSMVAAKINRQGKLPSLFCIDELPTIYIAKLDQLPATGRANKVITLLGLQLYSQLEEQLGRSQADVIFGNLGNQFHGMANETAIAKKIVDMFGKIEVSKESYSYDRHGKKTSTSVSTVDKDVFQTRDIMGLEQGRFVGKLSNGSPAWFNHQYKLEHFDKFELPRKEKNPEFLKKKIQSNYLLIQKQAELVLKDHSQFRGDFPIQPTQAA